MLLFLFVLGHFKNDKDYEQDHEHEQFPSIPIIYLQQNLVIFEKR